MARSRVARVGAVTLAGVALLALVSRVGEVFLPARFPAHGAAPATTGRGGAGSASPVDPSVRGSGHAALGAAAAVVAACGAVALPLARRRARKAAEKTQRHYSTAYLLPSLVWTKIGFKENEIEAGELYSTNLVGLDICFGKTESGKLFCIGNKVGPIGAPLNIVGEIVGETVRDTQYGSSWNPFTGEVLEYCTFPPVVGGFLGWAMGGAENLSVFNFRADFFSKEVEAQIDVNARKAYEAPYWKGVLDAQGKDDGSYY